MDGGLLLMMLAGLGLNLLLIYLIIKSAINSSDLIRQMEIQNSLLAKLAEKQGVNKSEIVECFG